MPVPERSDAFVLFGATGDLAYKKILPALPALIRHGDLDMPIIGMARAGWTLDALRDRAGASLKQNGGVDADAFDKLSAGLRYVGGDCDDPSTFERLRRTLGEAPPPLHYVEIPRETPPC
jgi:glucose-6-phosphate 1-dehydrogenase